MQSFNKFSLQLLFRWNHLKHHAPPPFAPPDPRHYLTVDCASLEEGSGIWTGYLSYSGLILLWVFRFLQAFTDSQDRISPLLVNNSLQNALRRSLNVSSPRISLWKLWSVWLTTKFVFEEKYFHSGGRQVRDIVFMAFYSVLSLLETVQVPILIQPFPTLKVHGEEHWYDHPSLHT